MDWSDSLLGLHVSLQNLLNMKIRASHIVSWMHVQPHVCSESPSRLFCNCSQLAETFVPHYDGDAGIKTTCPTLIITSGQLSNSPVLVVCSFHGDQIWTEIRMQFMRSKIGIFDIQEYLCSTLSIRYVQLSKSSASLYMPVIYFIIILSLIRFGWSLTAGCKDLTIRKFLRMTTDDGRRQTT